MIGNEYGVKIPSELDIEKLCEPGKKTYKKLLQTDRRKAVSVARYFIDIEKTVIKCRNILNSNGMTLFVIGNTQYKNTEIDNAGYLAEMHGESGFSGYKRS